MSNLIEEITRRRARRALSETAIPPEVMTRIMKAATLAPSCFNNQPARFLVAQGTEALERVRKHLSGGNYWVLKSPAVVLAATRTDLDCQLDDNRDYALFDLGLGVENLILQAFREGLIAHPIAGFKAREIKQEFGIPDDYTLITLVVLGYPGDGAHLNEKHAAAETAEQVRKPVEEVVFYDEWKSE